MSKEKVKKLKVMSTKQTAEENFNSEENSFLHEISFDVTIDHEIRKEIEKKFQNSSVNAAYVFPRTATPVKSTLKKNSSRARSQSRSKSLNGKTLLVTKNLSNSNHNLKSSNSDLKRKINKAASCARKINECKVKFVSSIRNPQILPHKRSASQCSKRPKTPILQKENALGSSVKRTKFRHRKEEGEKVCKSIDLGKSVTKHIGHSYTKSFGVQGPGLNWKNFQNFLGVN